MASICQPRAWRRSFSLSFQRVEEVGGAICHVSKALKARNAGFPWRQGVLTSMFHPFSMRRRHFETSQDVAWFPQSLSRP